MMFLKRLLFPFICVLLLSGCSGTDALNLLVPRTGYTAHKDIAYGANPRQKLDIYVPDKQAEGSPVMMFFYGGRWQSGNKKDYRFVGQAFASKGFIAVIADYRLYPEVYFPAFMQDAAKAFKWTHDHIDDYGGNSDNIFVSGHSAGGYIAVMLTLNDSYLKEAGAWQQWIRGAIGIAGPYDFLPFTDPKVKALFSKTADRDTQPINFVTPGLPPLLLAAGDADTEVLPKNTAHLAAKLRENDDTVVERNYPGVGHVGIALSLANGFRGKDPLLDDIAAFVKEHKVAQ